MKIEVIREQPKTPPPVEFRLTLTPNEADMLRTIVGSIAGSGLIRGFADELFRHLVDHTPGNYANNVETDMRVR